VVIDEYVELAKLFGAEEGYKYVNGVLDGLSHLLRDPERRGG
jgi:N utilization substance protein B